VPAHEVQDSGLEEELLKEEDERLLLMADDRDDDRLELAVVCVTVTELLQLLPILSQSLTCCPPVTENSLRGRV
jgi:hypothetical protein